MTKDEYCKVETIRRNILAIRRNITETCKPLPEIEPWIQTVEFLLKVLGENDVSDTTVI